MIWTFWREGSEKVERRAIESDIPVSGPFNAVLRPCADDRRHARQFKTVRKAGLLEKVRLL
jgi:hypothetical protein